MKFHPPIKERGLDELIEIAYVPSKWQPEAVEQAKAELAVRGISVKEQEEKLDKWFRDEQAELRCETRKKSLIGYHPIQLILMSLQFPFTILWGWNLKHEGYHRMHKQRLWAIVSGVLLYSGCMVFVYFTASATEEAQRKLIQEQDISEWEKSYYGEVSDSVVSINPSL